MLVFTREQKEILVQVANVLKEHQNEIDRVWAQASPEMAETSISLRRRHLQQFVSHISIGDFEGWEHNLHDTAETLKQQKISLSLGDSLHFCSTASCLSYLMQEFPQKGQWRSVLLALECFQNRSLSLILNDFEHPAPHRKPEGIPLDRLTAREKEVLHLVVEGLSSKEIACRLKISVKTVEAHRANLMKKLGINSVVHLVRYVYQEGQRFTELPENNISRID